MDRTGAVLLRLLLLPTALLLSSTSAHAAPLSAPALHWVRRPGADACIAPRALAERVEALIAAPMVRAAEAEHAIEGSVERTQRVFRVRLRLRDRDGRLLGERSLQEAKPDCAALSEPLAFVIAMMIDPEVLAHGLPPSVMALLGEDAPELRLLDELNRTPTRPAPLAVAVAQEAPAPSALPARPAAAPAPPARGQVLLSLGSTFLQGAHPLLSAQLLGTIEVAPRIALGASAWGGSSLRAQSVSQGRSFRLSVAGFEALLCASSRSAPRVRVGACLGPTLRLHHAAGAGFGRDQSTTLVSGSAAALVQVRVRLRERWGVAAVLGGEVAFSRPRLAYENADGTRQVVRRFSLYGLSLGLGPSVEF